MKANKECILVKRKDYNKLVKEAEANKPDYIHISYLIDHYYSGSIRHYCNINSSFDLSHNLNRQINSISTKMSDEVIKVIDEQGDLMKERLTISIKDEINNDLKSKNIFQLIKYLKSK